MLEGNGNIQNQIKHGKTLSIDLLYDRETGDIAKWLGFVFWPAIIALTILFFWLTTKNSLHFAGNDCFYYLSIAENLFKNGLFLDGTLEPNGPILTPQNGIVVVYYFLMKMSLTNSQCLMAVTIMNYCMMFLAIYPIIKIAERIGLTDRLSRYALIAAYLGSLKIFKWVYMVPINDMSFLCGSLFLTYFIVMLYDQIYSDKKASRPLHAAHLFSSIVLSIILIHFRSNAVFIPIAAIGAAVLTRRFRILPIATVLLALMCLSLFGIYAFVNTGENVDKFHHFNRFLADIPKMIYYLLFQRVPESLFNDLSGAGNLMYLPFYLAMVIALIKGIVKREFLILMILFMSLMLFVLTLLFACVTFRYLCVVSPFMYMMILSVKKFRTIAFLFIAAILINSFWMIFDGISPGSRTTFWVHVSNKFEFNEDEVTIAFDGRTCWYYTGLKNLNENKYTWQQIQNVGKLYLGGKSIFFDEHSQKIKDMARLNEYEVRIEHLTPEYNDRVGNGLYRVHLEPKAQN